MLTRILHIIIILNMLASTTGVTVFEHACRKNGSLFGFFIKPDSCCKSKSKKCNVLASNSHGCVPEDGSQLHRSPCCKDQLHFHKTIVSAIKGSVSKFGKISCYPLFSPAPHPYLETALQRPEYKSRLIYTHSPPEPEDLTLLFRNFRC